MFWEKAIPLACRGLVGCFAFSLQDGELICRHYYSPFGKQHKELAILPETPSSSLAVALSYRGHPNQVACFGLDRDWVLDTVRAYGPIALHCDGHEASVLWKEDSTPRRVNCAIGRTSQAEHDQYEARCKSQEVDDMPKCRLCGKGLDELPDPLALHCNRLTGPYYANRYAKVGQISAVDGDKAAAQWSSVIAAAKKNSPEIFHQFF